MHRSGLDSTTGCFGICGTVFFPERGSGVGSRGQNLQYKRELLRLQGIENAASVLDVGCGDLEVLKDFNLEEYIGVDQSETALEIARQKRPDWKFFQICEPSDLKNSLSADYVLCFEVLIHQGRRDVYDELIARLSVITHQVLIVSGYDSDTDERRRDHMTFFPLSSLVVSLRQTGRFQHIETIAAHNRT